MQQWRCVKSGFLILLSGMVLLSCTKNDFLNKRPSSDLLIPTTLPDFQALLDNDIVIQETPELGELSADNFYIVDSTWQTLSSVIEQNAYIWAPGVYGSQRDVEDWDDPYQQIFYANIVLEGLPKIAIDSSNIVAWKAIQGDAHFIRAYAFYNLAQVFAPVYESTTAGEPGIFLRMSSPINQVSVLATVQQTYDTIILELQEANASLPLLPDPAHLNRSSKAAALAMLARVYLSMQNYDSAELYANRSLTIDSSLLNYDSVRHLKTPLAMTNPEVLYQSHLLSSSGVFTGKFSKGTFVDPNLYMSYADSDLRKSLFFLPSGKFNLSYSGSNHPFSGLATDEVYLIRAECEARANDSSGALKDINDLLANRFVKGTFVPYSLGMQTAALDIVLAERRKELVLRGIRWTDIRRLSAIGTNITLTRYLNSGHYTLNSPDQSYVLPIPPNVPH